MWKTLWGSRNLPLPYILFMYHDSSLLLNGHDISCKFRGFIANDKWVCKYESDRCAWNTVFFAIFQLFTKKTDCYRQNSISRRTDRQFICGWNSIFRASPASLPSRRSTTSVSQSARRSWGMPGPKTSIE